LIRRSLSLAHEWLAVPRTATAPVKNQGRARDTRLGDICSGRAGSEAPPPTGCDRSPDPGCGSERPPRRSQAAGPNRTQGDAGGPLVSSLPLHGSRVVSIAARTGRLARAGHRTSPVASDEDRARVGRARWGRCGPPTGKPWTRGAREVRVRCPTYDVWGSSRTSSRSASSSRNSAISSARVGGVSSSRSLSVTSSAPKL
jgi:hypothetical protein